MRFSFIFLLLLTGFSILAQAQSTKKTAVAKAAQVPSDLKEDEWALFDGKSKYQKIKIFSYNEMKLSINCKARTTEPNCDAFAVTKKLRATPINKTQNPASEVCSIQGGTGLIAIDNKMQPWEICQFADQSLIGSWGLYYSYFKK